MKEDAQGPIGRPPETALGGRSLLLPGFSISGLAIPALAMLAAALLALLFSESPLRALYFFFLGPFRNAYHFGNMLNSAVPLIVGALGVSVAMRAGNLNLGGEGQIYAGAFTAAITALGLASPALADSGFSIHGFAVTFLALAAGAVVAGIVAALSGLCKARWNTSELITSFLLSNALVLIVNYFVNGPFLDPASSLQSTAKIAFGLRLPLLLPPSNLNASLFIALALVIVTHIFLEKTRLGYELRMAGNNELFARYGGIDTKRNTVLAMFASGMFYGLAGGLAVFGTYYAAIREFSSGLGWTGLAAALMARFYPPLIVPATLFFAWITSGGRIAAQNTGLSIEVVSIVQALVFFLVTSARLRAFFRSPLKKRRR